MFQKTAPGDCPGDCVQQRGLSRVASDRLYTYIMSSPYLLPFSKYLLYWQTSAETLDLGTIWGPENVFLRQKLNMENFGRLHYFPYL